MPPPVSFAVRTDVVPGEAFRPPYRRSGSVEAWSRCAEIGFPYVEHAMRIAVMAAENTQTSLENRQILLVCEAGRKSVEGSVHYTCMVQLGTGTILSFDSDSSAAITSVVACPA